MSIPKVAALGCLIQVLGLAGFVYVAGLGWALWAKDAVLVLTTAAMAVLLAGFNWSYSLPRSLAASALLAFGYAAGYLLLGSTVYPGLLKDLRDSVSVLVGAILPVFGVLFVLYFLYGAFIGAAHWLLARRRRGNRPSDSARG